MHISEGVLRPEILVGGAAASSLFAAYALKKLKNEEIPLTAVFSALFFIGSFIHIPIGPASIHLVLNGLVGAILGIRAFIAIGIALLLQGVLFGFGGITTLGINTFNIAFPAFLGYLIFHMDTKGSLWENLKYFMVGFIPVALSAFLLSSALALNGEEFYSAAKLALMANLPVMIIEGVVTLFIIRFLKKVYPQIFIKDTA